MNKQRYLFATLGAFAFIFGFEFLYHGLLMKDLYAATVSVWRPQSDCNMAVMMLSQLLFAAVLALIYTCVGKHLCCKKGVQFGLFAGLLLAMPQLATYCYLPIPLKISLLWMLASVLKCVGASLVIALIYKEA